MKIRAAAKILQVRGQPRRSDHPPESESRSEGLGESAYPDDMIGLDREIPFRCRVETVFPVGIVGRGRASSSTVEQFSATREDAS